MHIAHPALLAFLRESSLGGIDPSLSYRVDYMGDSDALQPTLRDVEERGRAWRFEALVDVEHHKYLIDAQDYILSDYFLLHILQDLVLIEPCEVVCYSLPRKIGCLQTRDSVPIVLIIVGFFQHKS